MGMTLEAYLKRKDAKNLTALSKALGISKGRMSQLRHAKEWPPELALGLEEATEGRLDASRFSAVIRKARMPQVAA